MSSEFERRRMLVVEDEQAIRELLRVHLELAGFEIDEAGDGRAALDRVRSSAFDLLILDVMLPGLDVSPSVRRCGVAAPTRTHRS
jgi:DNA-binding response OmpR family regulator